MMTDDCPDPLRRPSKANMFQVSPMEWREGGCAGGRGVGQRWVCRPPRPKHVAGGRDGAPWREGVEGGWLRGWALVGQRWVGAPPLQGQSMLQDWGRMGGGGCAKEPRPALLSEGAPCGHLPAPLPPTLSPPPPLPQGFRWLTMDMKPGDSLVFHFSGGWVGGRVYCLYGVRGSGGGGDSSLVFHVSGGRVGWRWRSWLSARAPTHLCHGPRYPAEVLQRGSLRTRSPSLLQAH